MCHKSQECTLSCHVMSCFIVKKEGIIVALSASAMRTPSSLDIYIEGNSKPDDTISSLLRFKHEGERSVSVEYEEKSVENQGHYYNIITLNILSRERCFPCLPLMCL